MTRRAITPALIAVLLLGLGLRAAFLLLSHPHVDEYSSVWAAMRVWQFGVPILPSEVLYLQGVLFTYIEAPFVGPFGFSEIAARLPSLVAGMAAVLLAYRWGRRVAGSYTGLLAGTLVALEAASVIWSGRARMYALQQALLTLSLYAFYAGFVDESGRGSGGAWRWTFAIAFGGALLSQTSTVIVVPGLLMALLLVWRRLSVRFNIWLPLALAALAVVLALGLNRLGGPVVDASTRPFFEPAFPWRLKPGVFFQEFFWAWPDWLRTLPVLAGSAWLLVHRRAPRPDRSLRTLAVLVLGALLPMIFLVGETWQRPRYLIALLPAIDVLSAAMVVRLGREYCPVRDRSAAAVLAAVIWLGVLAAFLPTAVATIGPSEPAYDLAYRFVRDRLAPTDAVLSPLPSISGAYLGYNSGYALQDGYEEYVVNTSDGLVDRWTGSPLVRSVPEMESLIPPDRRIWFVVDDARWRERYDHEFRSRVESAMRIAFRDGGVTVFERLPSPLPPAGN